MLFRHFKKDISPELDNFFQYFDTTYVGELIRTRGRATKWVRKNPLFDIELSSVHSRINDCIPHTNNFIEVWHHAFLVYLFEFLSLRYYLLILIY